MIQAAVEIIADIRDQIGQIWLIGAQNLEPPGLHVCEEECNSSFASIYKGWKDPAS